MVQFAIKDSQQLAETQWDNLLLKYPQLLSGHNHAILVENKTKVFYRLQVEFPNKETAQAAVKIFRADKIDCFVPVQQSYQSKKPN